MVYAVDEPRVARMLEAPMERAVAPKRVIALDGSAWGLLTLRGPLLAALAQEGHEVVACAPIDRATQELASGEIAASFSELNVVFRPFRMDRQGMNPLRDLAAVRELVSILDELMPDVVLTYSMKATVLGWIAASVSGVPERYCSLTGLGYLFLEDSALDRYWKWIPRLPLRLAVRSCKRVFVQNRDDLELLLQKGLLLRREHAVIVDGSGIDLRRFAVAELPALPLTFLMIARLHRHKGVREFARAAAMLKGEYPETRFLLVGPRDEHPTALTDQELEEVVSSRAVEWVGGQKDVRPFIAQSHVFVLPSYREGTSRSMLEAMALGRPVVATDVPGCREPVKPGENGFLVPVKDENELAFAMRRFVQAPELVARFGRRSRAIVEERYQVAHVVQQMVDTMFPDPKRRALNVERNPSFDLKRGLDLVLASCGFVTLVPVLLGISAAVKIDSPGLVLYRGLRTGYQGKTFRILKFRTMVVDAEKTGGLSTAKDDPRITRVGRFLRKWKLDELPQLVNVMLGEMSLVGPRPEMPEYTALYQGEEELILTVRPGITDLASMRFHQLAQVLGKEDADRVYEEQVMPVKNALRVRYVKSRSMFLDLVILYRTLFRVGNFTQGTESA